MTNPRLIPMILGLLCATSAFAAGPILEDFDDMSLPSTLEQSDPGDPADFSTGAVVFPGIGDLGRNYLRTVDDDFDSIDFTADATITVVESGLLFFGLGAGQESAFFEEPRTAPYLFIRVHPDNFEDGIITLNDGPEVKTEPDVAGTGTHRIRMIWTAADEQAYFQIHKDYAGGPFIATKTLGPIDGSDNGFSASDSRIFFGGSNAVVVDDFRVIPRALDLRPTPCPIDLTGEISAPAGTDADFYEIVVESTINDFFEFDIDAIVHGSTAHTMVGLYDENFNLLVFAFTSTMIDPYLTKFGQSAGNYFIAVAAYPDTDFDGSGGFTVGPYQLQGDWCDGGSLFSDSFEFGSTVRWSSTTP